MPSVHLLIVIATLVALPHAMVVGSDGIPTGNLIKDPPLTAQVSDLPLIDPSEINGGPPTKSRVETPSTEAIDLTSTGLSMLTTATPDSERLATWQSRYLGLLGDHATALVGFYDPFSYQFAYGSDDTWLYAAGEYNLDAYEVDLQGPQVSKRGQTSDYRVLIRASATTGIWTMFLEGGIVTDRHLRFRGSAPDFEIGDSAFLRTGILFERLLRLLAPNVAPASGKAAFFERRFWDEVSW